MKINNIEFDYNATTLKGLESLEKAMAPCATSVLEGEKLMKQGSFVEGAKKQIDAFRQFFIDLANVDIVGECDNVTLATAMFEDFQKQVEEQKKRVKENYFKRV